jgi:predicted O-methyltransferase YrrM
MNDPYASHLPVLDELGETVEMRRVLELGPGLHSTAWFLRRPELERLVSLETNEEWFTRIPLHEKLTLRYVGDIPTALAEYDLTDFDLVFVDNGDTATEREPAIRAVLSQPHPIVVIHDAEVPQYRAAIDDFADCELFEPEVPRSRLGDPMPWTAVVR